jgi:hypothetical protein
MTFYRIIRIHRQSWIRIRIQSWILEVENNSFVYLRTGTDTVICVVSSPHFSLD